MGMHGRAEAIESSSSAGEQIKLDEVTTDAETAPFSLHAGARKNVVPSVLRGPARTRRILRRRRKISTADEGVSEYLVIDDPAPNTAAAVKGITATLGIKATKVATHRRYSLDRRSPFLFLLILTIALITTASLAGTRLIRRITQRGQVLEFDEEKFIIGLITQGQNAVKPLETQLPLARNVIKLGNSLKRRLTGKLKLMEPDDRSRVAFAALNVRQIALYLAGEHEVDTTELFRLLEKHVGEKEFHALMKLGSRLGDPRLGPCPDEYLAEEDDEYKKWRDNQNELLDKESQRHEVIRQTFYASLMDILHTKPEVYKRINAEVQKLFVGAIKMDEYIDQIKEGYDETEKAFGWNKEDNIEFEHMCLTLHQLLIKKFELLSCKVRLALAMINSSVSYSSVKERVSIEHNAILQNAYYDEYLEIAEREDLPSSLVEILEPSIFTDPYQNTKVLELREFIRGWTSAWKDRFDENVDLGYSYGIREKVLETIFFQPFVYTWKELTPREKQFVAQTNKHILGEHTSGLELDEVFDKLERMPVPLRSLYDTWDGLFEGGS